MLARNIISSTAIATYGAFALGLVCLAMPSQAQEAEEAEQPPIIYQPNPDSPIGERNPEGPAELAQYDFLIGDWDVDITWYFPGQDPSNSNAKWHNHWIVDGRVLMLEWRGPQFTGTELRQWDAEKNVWVGVNIYPDFGSHMPEVTSYKDDENMLVFIPFEGPNGPGINRETYYDIEENSYKMKSDQSFDNGETWERGLYEMTVWRSAD